MVRTVYRRELEQKVDRLFMPQIESHGQSITLESRRTGRADPSRAQKGPLRKMGRLFQGDFYFRAARGARLLFRDIVHITRNYSPTKQVDHSFNLPRAAAIPPCAG